MISKTMILMMIRMKIIVTMMKISKTMVIMMSMVKIINLLTATKVEVTQSVTMAGKGSNLMMMMMMTIFVFKLHIYNMKF